MSNIKLKITQDTGTNIIECHEEISDISSISFKINSNDVSKLMLGKILKLSYITHDMETVYNDSEIIKFQIDSNDDSVAYVKFKYKILTVSKTKYKLLKETVDNLFNTHSNFIALDLGRQSGHTSTLLWMMNWHDDAILVVRNQSAKSHVLQLISDYKFYNIRKNNIKVVSDCVDIHNLFAGMKYSKIFIDDYSLFSKDILQKIVDCTRYSSNNEVRYLCLG